MALGIGDVLEGKVTGIAKFGAFVALPEGKSGLVHISEVANSYVSDVSEHLQVGQTVKVRVMNVSDDGKINLSIKRALDPAPTREKERTAPPRRTAEAAPAQSVVNGPGDNRDFEDRLKRFMQESDSRIADNRIYSEHKQRSRRR